MYVGECIYIEHLVSVACLRAYSVITSVWNNELQPPALRYINYSSCLIGTLTGNDFDLHINLDQPVWDISCAI